MSMLVAVALAGAAVPTLPNGPQLVDAVRAADTALFQLAFDRCDPAAMRAAVTDDFEMYHDRDGVVARNGRAFVADYAKDCARWAAPGAWRSRRELEQATLNVHPIPGYGAIEDGWHRFYERRGDGPEKLVGRGRFTHLWALTPTGWRLARVFSFDHRAVE